MPLDDEAAAELKSLIGVARKRDLNFGLSLGKDPADTALVLHRMKSPEVLMRTARAAEGVDPSKSTFGTIGVKGKVVTFTCLAEAPAGIARKCKQFFASIGMPMKVVVLDATGAILEEDGDDEPADGDASGTSKEEMEWQYARAAIEPAIMEFLSKPREGSERTADEERIGRVRTAWDYACQAAQEGDFVTAFKVLDRIETVIADTAPQQVTDASWEDKWRSAARQMEPHVLAALQAGKGEVDKIRAVWAFAQSKAEAATPEGYESAMKSLSPLARLLSEARKQDKSPAEMAAAQMDGIESKKAQLLDAWKKAIERMGPLVAETVAQLPDNVVVLKDQWTAATQKAEVGDYAGAIGLLKDIRDSLAFAKVQLALKAKEPDILQVLSLHPEDATLLRAQWMALGDLAKTDPEKALRLLAAFEARVNTLKGQPAVAQGAVAQDTVKIAAALKAATAAMGEVGRVQELIEGYRVVATQAWDAPVPPDWMQKIAELSKSLELKAEDGLDAITAAMEKVLADLDVLEKAVREQKEARAAFEAAWEVFNVRFTTLKRHKRANDDPPIKGKVDSIAADLAKAEAEAKAARFEAAKRAIAPLIVRCDETETEADAYAQYLRIKADRLQRVGTLEGLVSLSGTTDVSGETTVTAAVAAVRKLYDDGVAKATGAKPDYLGAIADLNKVPKAEGEATVLTNQAKAYVAGYKLWKDWLTDPISKVTGPLRSIMLRDIEWVQAAVEAMSFDRTKDYAKSVSLINSGEGRYNIIEATRELAQNYIDAEAKTRRIIADVAGHKGKEGIATYDARLTSDLEYARSRARLGEYALAETILSNVNNLEADQKKIADDCEAYLDCKEEVAKLIGEVDANDKESLAATEKGHAQTFQAQAETLATARDYPGALAAMNQAKARIDRAKELLAAQKAFDDAVPKGEVGKAGTDFDAAYKAYTDADAHVAGLTGKDAFAAQIASAKSTAELARTENAKPRKEDDPSSGPDASKMQDHINDAIRQLGEVVRLIQRKESYDALRTTLQAEHDTTLPALNVALNPPATGKAIDPEIRQIKMQLDNAAAKAAPSGGTPDYPNATADIVEGMKIVERAKVKAGLIVEINENERLAKENLDYYSDPGFPDFVAIIADEIARSQTVIAEIAALISANDFKAAQKKAKFASELTAKYKPLADEWSLATTEKATVEAAANGLNGVVVRNIGLTSGALSDIEICKPEYDQALENIAQMQVLIDSKAFKGAKKLGEDTRDFLISKSLLYKGEGPAFQVACQRARTALDLVRAQACPAIAAELEALEKRGAEALKRVDPQKERHLKWATSELDKIAADCPALVAKGTLAKAYEAARAAAETAVATLNVPGIGPIKTRLEGKYASALDIAGKGDLAEAKSLLDPIKAECEAAVIAAGEHANALTAAADVSAIPDAGGEDLHAAIRDAEAQLGSVLAHADAAFVVPITNRASDEIATTKSQAAGEPVKAKVALGAARVLIADAKRALAAFVQLRDEKDAALAKIKALVDDPAHGAVIKSDADALQKSLQETFVAARIRATEAPIVAAIEATNSGYHRLRQILGWHAEYALKHTPLAETLKTLEAHDARYSIKAEIDALRDKLAGAAADVSQKAYPEALKALKEASDMAERAKLRADLNTDAAPRKSDIEAILKMADGPKELDKIVTGLDAQTQRKVLRAAAEVRFGCKMQMISGGSIVSDGNAKGPNVKRYYEVMSKLPPKDTLGNDGLEIWGHDMTPTESSAHYSGSRKVVMRDGDASGGTLASFLDDEALKSIEPSCRPTNKDPVPHFNWNTVHEVGHAVDDAKSFMTRNLGNDAYGGWVELGGNVKPVAELFKQKFGYDVTYIMAYMTGTADPPEPEVPVGTDPNDWERQRLRVRTAIDQLGCDKNPWDNLTLVSHATMSDGKAYHEAYPRFWMGYTASARSKAISTYQFRSPYEWFSELYAAYHCGKLQKGHPSMSWLETL